MSPVGQTDLAAYLQQQSNKPRLLPRFGRPGRLLLYSWACCLISAVQYLHNENVVHLDIKPKNILVSADKAVYLADFGTAIDRTNENPDQASETQQRGSGLTLKYCAPEALKHKEGMFVNASADIFSLGAVFAELCTVDAGLSIQEFENFRSSGTSNSAFHSTIPKTHLWIDMICLAQTSTQWVTYRRLQTIKKMLSFDPSKRPTMAEVAAAFRLTIRSQLSFETSQSSCQNDCNGWLEVLSEFWAPTCLPSCKAYLPNEASDESGCRQASKITLPRSFVSHSAPLLRVNKNIYKFKVIDLEYSSLILTSKGRSDDVENRYGTEMDAFQRAFQKIAPKPYPEAIGFSGSLGAETFQSYHRLGEYCKISKPPPTIYLKISLLCDALALLEALKVLHEPRDLNATDKEESHCCRFGFKPINILVVQSPVDRDMGRPKFILSDFGLSDSLNDSTNDDGDQPTKTSDHGGCSPDYITTRPEIARIYDVWSLGCQYLKILSWLNAAICHPDSSNKSRSVDGKEEHLDDDWINKQDHKSAQSLLRNLRGKSDPVTQSICDNVIADMLKPPETRSSAERLWDKTKHFVQDGLQDFIRSLAKAAIPLQRWLPDRSKGSLSVKTNWSVSSETSESKSQIWKERDELVPLATQESDENPMGWDSGEFLRLYFLRGDRDYRSYCVPEFDWLQGDTKLLHKELLRSMVDKILKRL